MGGHRGVFGASSSGPDTSHRYWRIYSYASNDSSFTQICEIKFRTVPGGPDINLSGVVATVDSTPQAGSASQMIDGNSGTFCQLNGEFNHWFMFDFGVANEKTIKEVLINGAVGAAARSPYWFDVQYSDNGTTWTTSWTVFMNSSSYTNTSTFVTFTRPNIGNTARRYMMIPSRNVSTVYAYAEIAFASSFNGSNLITSSSMILAASSFNGTPGAYIDGNINTWDATNGTQWWQRMVVDFGGGNEQDVKEIRLLPRQDFPTQWAAGMDIYYGIDGDSWLPKWSTGGASGGTIVNSHENAYSVVRNPANISGGTTHRYWGLKINAFAGGGVGGVRQVQFRDSVGGVTNCTGGQGKSLCYWNGSNLPRYGFDSSTNEYASGFSSDILAYDYGDSNLRAKPVEIAITSRSSGLGSSQSPSNFDLVYSDDGFTWTVQQSYTSTGWSDLLTRTFAVT
jgi:hypothetical protein